MPTPSVASHRPSVGWARIFMGLAPIVAMLLDVIRADRPSEVGITAFSVALIALGVATLTWSTSETLADWRIDVALLCGVLVAGYEEQAGYTVVVALFAFFFAGRHDRRTVWQTLAALLLAEAARKGLAAATGWEVDLADSILGLFLPFGIGLAMGRLAEEAQAATIAARDAAEEARSANRLKTDFVAVTTHELRNPVAAIHGLVSTLDAHGRTLDPDAVKDVLDAIRRQTSRLLRLTDDLTTVSHLDTGQLDIHLANVNLQEIVEGVVEAAGEGRATITGEPATVTADRMRLEQILTNLITNGLKHGADHVDVHWRPTAHAVKIEVADNGPGIPEADRERIFERFVQLPGGSREGSGLGLPIARDLAERMGGQLTLAEAGSDGCRFVLELPAGQPSNVEDPALR